ncbi:hypothetical protein E2C01_077548 [Portunus trituberculatus]|uniref:Uncharacterized protein n=1 Tax=Portunus trituberculatus TaxID=210409 RepID=A0A5B7IGB3_PORTR|nr:hypothetical protein [Portunus trituberculatus]
MNYYLQEGIKNIREEKKRPVKNNVPPHYGKTMPVSSRASGTQRCGDDGRRSNEDLAPAPFLPPCT